MALPDGLRQALTALALDNASEIDRVRRLFEFMVAEDGLALHYLAQPTYGIAESYARREVHCLSFTMFFFACPGAAGFDASAPLPRPPPPIPPLTHPSITRTTLTPVSSAL